MHLGVWLQSSPVFLTESIHLMTTNINDCAMIYANGFMITTNRMRPLIYHWLMQDNEGESLEACLMAVQERLNRSTVILHSVFVIVAAVSRFNARYKIVTR